MDINQHRSKKILLDLQKLNEINAMGYAGKFCLGDTVVAACGDWNGEPRYILERDAIFDKQTNAYWQRDCYNTKNRKYI